MMSQVPSVGRIVHYVSHGTPAREDGTRAFHPECRAAVITAVLSPSGMFFNEGCRHSEGAQAGGTWHWPEVVGA